MEQNPDMGEGLLTFLGGLKSLQFNPTPLSYGLLNMGAKMMAASSPSLDPASGSFGSALGQGIGGFSESYIDSKDREAELDALNVFLDKEKNPQKYALPEWETFTASDGMMYERNALTNETRPVTLPGQVPAYDPAYQQMQQEIVTVPGPGGKPITGMRKDLQKYYRTGAQKSADSPSSAGGRLVFGPSEEESLARRLALESRYANRSMGGGGSGSGMDMGPSNMIESAPDPVRERLRNNPVALKKYDQLKGEEIAKLASTGEDQLSKLDARIAKIDEGIDALGPHNPRRDKIKNETVYDYKLSTGGYFPKVGELWREYVAPDQAYAILESIANKETLEDALQDFSGATSDYEFLVGLSTTGLDPNKNKPYTIHKNLLRAKRILREERARKAKKMKELGTLYQNDGSTVKLGDWNEVGKDIKIRLAK